MAVVEEAVTGYGARSMPMVGCALTCRVVPVCAVECWRSSATGAAMSTLIRVDELPAAERFEFLHEMVAQTWVPMECHSDYRADYRAVLRSSGLGAIQVVVMDILAIKVCRTPGLIRRADPDMDEARQRRPDLFAFEAAGEERRPRVVPEGVHRWLNGRMQLAP